MARLIPFHDAIIVYFCLAVKGSRGSGAAGGGGSLGPKALFPSAFELFANLPNSQPIIYQVSCVSTKKNFSFWSLFVQITLIVWKLSNFHCLTEFIITHFGRMVVKVLSR